MCLYLRNKYKKKITKTPHQKGGKFHLKINKEIIFCKQHKTLFGTWKLKLKQKIKIKFYSYKCFSC